MRGHGVGTVVIMPREGKPQPLDDGTGHQLTDSRGQAAWRLRVRDKRTGRQKEETFYGSYEAAVRRRTELTTAINSGPETPARKVGAITWGTAVVEALADYAWEVKPSRNGANPGKRRPATTWNKVRNNLDYYTLPDFETTKLATISAEDLNDHILGLTRKDGQLLSPSTMETIGSAVRMVLTYAHRSYGLPNLAPLINTTWGERGSRRRTAIIPSLREVETLAAAMDKVWPYPSWGRHVTGPNGEGFGGDCVRVLAYTGLRWEEFVALKPAHVKLADHMLEIRDTASESGGVREHRQDAGKTVAAQRHPGVPEQAEPALRRLNALRRLGKQREPDRQARRDARADRGRRPVNRPLEERWTTVVNGERGGWLAYRQWTKKLRAAREQCGVGYSAHVLRHLCASLMYAAGSSEGEIMDQMGHSSINTTRRIYRHLFLVERREVARRMSEGIATILAAEQAEAERQVAGEGEPSAEERAELEDEDW